MANMTTTKKIKGSNNTSVVVMDLGVGSGLDITGTDLVLNPASAQKAGNTQFGVVEFNLAGDLVDNGTNSGIANVKAKAITNAKIADMTTTKKIKGSNNTSVVVMDLGVGSGLDITGTDLVLNPASAQKAGNTQFGVVEFNSAGDLVDNGTNSGVANVKAKAITNAKIADMNAFKKIKGSNDANLTVMDLGVGSGLDITGTDLVLNLAAAPKADTSVFGTIQFAPSGDLVTGLPGIAVIGANKVSYAKLQQAAPSTLLGTASTNANPGNYGAITLGPSMSMVGNALNAGVSFVAGPDPNITAPTDRPSTTNVLYVGVNASAWIWNGSTYILQTSGLVPTIGPWISEPNTITAAPLPLSPAPINPTKGTTIIGDYIKYRAINSKEYMVEMFYSQSTGGTAGNKQYLFKLPTGLTFSPTIYIYNINETVTRTDIGRSNKSMKQFFGYITEGTSSLDMYVQPYDATRFRIHTFIGTGGTGERFLASDWYGLNTLVTYTVQFILETP